MIRAADLAARIEACFAQIATTRMAGVPVLNPAVRVEMRGLQRRGDDWLGVLVTPWFMNLMLLPATGHGRRIGEKRDLALPSGCYQAIWNHEDGLGGYWSCSLFSPMFEFSDHEAAMATADAALAEILALPSADQPLSDADRMAMVWAGATVSPSPATPPLAGESDGAPAAISRRALFRLPSDAVPLA